MLHVQSCSDSKQNVATSAFTPPRDWEIRTDVLYETHKIHLTIRVDELSGGYLYGLHKQDSHIGWNEKLDRSPNAMETPIKKTGSV